MNTLVVPEFKSYVEEAEFWDNLDTGDFMEDNGEWFTFDTPEKRAVHIAILPEVANAVAQQTHSQGVSLETLVNVWLIERIHAKTSALLQ